MKIFGEKCIIIPNHLDVLKKISDIPERDRGGKEQKQSIAARVCFVPNQTLIDLKIGQKLPEFTPVEIININETGSALNGNNGQFIVYLKSFGKEKQRLRMG